MTHRMSRSALIAAIPLIAALGAQPARAADKTVNVKATVSEVCKFRAATVTLDFQTLDPSAGDAVTATEGLKYYCTNGTKPSALGITGITGASTTRTLKKDGSNDAAKKFDYTLSWDATPAAGRGFSDANFVSINVTGSIAAGVYKDVEAGKYEDSVTFTLAP